jgi:DNA (cytosine-5)-methyltransferase 1
MFIFENVKGILKIKDDSGRLVIDNIVEQIEKVGYNVVHKVLNSKDFGSAQSRERVYFVGCKNDLDKKPSLDIKPVEEKKYICDILEPQVDDYYLLKNLWANIKNHRLPGTRYDAIIQAYNNSKQKEPKELQHQTLPIAVISGDTPSGHSRQTDRVYSSKGLSPTLLCTGYVNIDQNGQFRKLTPLEYCRLQCFPEDFKIPNNQTQTYKQFGNAVCVNVIKYIMLNNI